MHRLARDAGISQATGYRYLHEGIDVLAHQAPDLCDVLTRCQKRGMTQVILDGTLIESDRAAGDRANGNDLWFCQNQKVFGGNVQFLSHPRPRRTRRRRRTQTALAYPAAGHSQSEEDRRHRPRGPCPQRHLELITIENTSLSTRSTTRRPFTGQPHGCSWGPW
ncbi:hypothetical protein [Streptomyces sp. NRRL B-2790]|uniref:hypothetical protein n=1 Tax=Streptomyces sp. NRRL B-2790 TaxID=1463835 RepID=UPI003564B1C8